MKDNDKVVGDNTPFPKLILASQSPRRKEILKAHGHNPVILPANVDETVPENMTPEDAVMLLALKKGRFVLENNRDFFSDNCVIIASDTVVYKGEILGKPKDMARAREMIKKLRRTSHEVITGVALIQPGTNREYCFYEVTKVFCKDMKDEEVEAYVNTQDPYDKAGGYGIQGTFGKYIDHIEGDYENVVGLPYNRLSAELSEFLNRHNL